MFNNAIPFGRRIFNELLKARVPSTNFKNGMLSILAFLLVFMRN